MKPSILIIDDDPALLESLIGLIELRLPEAIPEACASSLHALERVTVKDYDAIVSDIKMPQMDGVTLMKRIQALRPMTPTLLITGHGDRDLAVQSLNAGAYAFINKPIDRDFFIAWLIRAVDLRRLCRDIEEKTKLLERQAVEVEHANRSLQAELVERRRTEEKLLESQRQHVEAQRLATLGTWSWDTAKNHLKWSPELCRVYGIGPEDFEGTYEGFLKRTHPDDVAPTIAIVRTAMENHQAVTYYHRIIRGDGTTRVLFSRATVLTDSDGKVTGMLGACQDVTEIKETEHALRTLQAELDQRVAGRTKELEQVISDLKRRIQELESSSLKSVT
jgi:PAS domain S-box-containing protein